MDKVKQLLAYNSWKLSRERISCLWKFCNTRNSRKLKFAFATKTQKFYTSEVFATQYIRAGWGGGGGGK